MTACGFPSPPTPLNFQYSLPSSSTYSSVSTSPRIFAQSPLLSIAFFKVDRLPVPTVTQSTSDLSTFFSSTQSGWAAAVPANSSSGMRCGERNPMKFVPLKWKLGFWLWRYLRTRHLRGVLCWKPILCASCNVSNSLSMVWLNCEFTLTGS